MKKLLLCTFLITLFVSNAFAQRKDYLVTLKTNMGEMHLILFDETPLHKANFIKYVNNKFYDSLMFHRVIDKFMIQGGDPNSRTAVKDQRLGGGGANLERVPFEFNTKRLHVKGALAAARDNNPEKKSSGCQFYIVQGRKYNDTELATVEKNNEITYTAEQKEVYKKVGGVPFLDNKYTVYGQVLDNLQLIDEIALLPRDGADRPYDDVRMFITVKKYPKKRITKKYGYIYESKKKKS